MGQTASTKNDYTEKLLTRAILTAFNYDNLGLGKEKCEAVIGQKISIKIEGETHEKLTFQFTYDGTPDLNTDPIETEAGQEKPAVIPHIGQGTFLYKVLEVTDEAETVESTFNAEKTGSWKMVQKYTPKGLDLVSRQIFFLAIFEVIQKGFRIAESHQGWQNL